MHKTTTDIWDQYTEVEKKFLISLHRAQRISTHTISKLTLENKNILELAKNIYKNHKDSDSLEKFTNELRVIDNYRIRLTSLIIRIRPFYLSGDLSIYTNLFKFPNITLSSPKNFDDQELRKSLIKEIGAIKSNIRSLDFNNEANREIKRYIIEDISHSKASGREELQAFSWAIVTADEISKLYSFIVKEFTNFIDDPSQMILPVFTGGSRNV